MRLSCNDNAGIQMLKRTPLKTTPAREQILKLLQNATCPVSYEDIKNKISMDKATFYRNIIKFEEHGIIRSLESNDKKRYYELSRQKAHAHFICTHCNTIQCINKNLQIQLKGYEIDDITIKGICPSCQDT